MLVDHSREKLINTILFFASNTKYCGKIKLFKLLYLFDFEHFRLTGKSVTGLDYHAWKYGPVPIDLDQEWDELEDDLAEKIAIKPEPVIDHVRETVVPKADFDDTHFTKRQLRLLDELSSKYANAISHKMIDVTHAENGAWAKVWNGGIGYDETIPYELSLSDDTPNRNEILEMAKEYHAIQQRNQGKRRAFQA